MLTTTYATKVGKQYRDYLELKGNISRIKRMVSYYTEYYKFTDFFSGKLPRDLEDSDVIPMNAIFLSIIILYAKCFTSSDRRIHLNEDIFKSQKASVIISHKNIMQMRHKFIAHAGKSDFESYELIIGFDGSFCIQMSPENSTTYAGECVEEENISPLLKIIENHIDSKISIIKKKIDVEVTLLEERIHLFFDKAQKNLPIIDSDLK